MNDQGDVDISPRTEPAETAMTMDAVDLVLDGTSGVFLPTLTSPCRFFFLAGSAQDCREFS
jgi:hypothetical protein